MRSTFTPTSLHAGPAAPQLADPEREGIRENDIPLYSSSRPAQLLHETRNRLVSMIYHVASQLIIVFHPFLFAILKSLH